MACQYEGESDETSSGGVRQTTRPRRRRRASVMNSLQRSKRPGMAPSHSRPGQRSEMSTSRNVMVRACCHPVQGLCGVVHGTRALYAAARVPADTIVFMLRRTVCWLLAGLLATFTAPLRADDFDLYWMKTRFEQEIGFRAAAI